MDDKATYSNIPVHKLSVLIGVFDVVWEHWDMLTRFRQAHLACAISEVSVRRNQSGKTLRSPFFRMQKWEFGMLIAGR